MKLSKEEINILEKYIRYTFPFSNEQHVKTKIDDFILNNGNPWKAISQSLKNKNLKQNRNEKNNALQRPKGHY